MIFFSFRILIVVVVVFVFLKLFCTAFQRSLTCSVYIFTYQWRDGRWYCHHYPAC
ncbi:unnamed protein product, partial [Vitis vinifera]|uniref:Uncharacterized protein n=1 Tax=Vitis vinifera TaxID=29760 RepID=D7SUB0_VITVI